MALLTTLDVTTTAGARDSVLPLLGTDLGRRRSEYAAMNIGDVAEADDGSGTMLIRRSKTDQAGEGTVKYLSPDAMAAITAWLAIRVESDDSPLPHDAPLLTSVDRFGRIGGWLSDDGIRDVLLRIARRGLRQLQPDLDDAAIAGQCRGLSGHSLRVALEPYGRRRRTRGDLPSRRLEFADAANALRRGVGSALGGGRSSSTPYIPLLDAMGFVAGLTAQN